MQKQFIMVALFIGLPSMLSAADWPQWLGQKRDGSTTESVAAWKEALKAEWSIPVGEGHSSPVVVDGKLYLHTKDPDKLAEHVQCIDIKTGAVIWSKSYNRPEFSSPFGLGPRATPVYDQGILYTYGVTGILTAWDTKTGDSLWQIDTLGIFKTPNLTFGVSSSPIIFGDYVIVLVGGKGSGVCAFEKKTGKIAWKSLDDRASYASPIIWNEQIIVLTEERLAGLNAKTGKEEWKVPFRDALSESSTTPVRLQGDSFLAGSVTTGSILAQVKPGEADKDGNSTWMVQNRWKKPVLTCYFATPVPLNQDYLLMHTGKILPPASGTLRCVNIATGEITWSEEKIGKYHASLMRLGNGRILMLDDSGNLSLLAPNDRKFELLAKDRLFRANGNAWAHPALVDGKLYVRDNEKLYCFPLPTE